MAKYFYTRLIGLSMALLIICGISFPSQLKAGVAGTINLTGSITQILDLKVDQKDYTTSFTNDQLVKGMPEQTYQDVAKLKIEANNYYKVTLSELVFTSSVDGASDITILAKLAPKGGSGVTGMVSGTSSVFNINDLNDGTATKGDVISVNIGANPGAAAGNWEAKIGVTLAAQ